MEGLKSVDSLAFMQVGACLLAPQGSSLEAHACLYILFSLPRLVTGALHCQCDASHIYVDFTTFAHRLMERSTKCRLYPRAAS